MDKKDIHTVIDVVEQPGGRLTPTVSYTRQGSLQKKIPAALGDKPTTAPIPDHTTRSYRWAQWGTYDDIPTVIRQKINDVPIAGRTVYDLVRMMYGNGLTYFKNDDLRAGNIVKRHYSDPIEKFLRANRIHDKWFVPQLYDYRYNVNAFSEITFNRRMDQAVGLYHKSAEFTRISQLDEQEYYSKDLYYSPYFAGHQQPKDEDIRQMPLYQFWKEEDILSQLPGKWKMGWHSCLETPGRVFYAVQPWIGLFRQNGWLDVSKAVPEVVNSMMLNQVRLKYQILIPESYFTIRYRDSWGTMGDEQRGKLIDDLVAEIDSTLSGTQNAYVSITTIFNYDNVTRTELGKIEVVAIDDKIKKDSWVPSSDKADAQIVQGLGGHPSSVGLSQENRSMGSGSGSDKRELYNIEISSNTIDQNIVLGPLQWIADFNARTNPDWDVTFFVDHTHHTTTNNQESGMISDPNTNITVE